LQQAHSRQLTEQNGLGIDLFTEESYKKLRRYGHHDIRPSIISCEWGLLANRNMSTGGGWHNSAMPLR